MVDIGANLAHDSFDADRDAVLERAQQAGVAQIVITGSCADSNRRVLTLARQHPAQLFATAGLHPHHASDWDRELADQLRELAADPQLVSLGECGLDYFRDLSPRGDQRRAFIEQLQIAITTGKPVFLHQRDAHADFHAILREHRSALSHVVVHCFTDTQAALEDYLALDCHIGITGWICDERRGQHLIDAVGIIPESRLMIETDAPYLLPRTAPKASHRRNEPGNLIWVARAIAAATQRSVEDVALATAATARAFFGLSAPT
ncbi:hydrolase TatD [Sinimarinibacterium sp. CAU 1509]|nr:hydrolase TatD [Sinimarinibacterium sp. CAU 1509]